VTKTAGVVRRILRLAGAAILLLAATSGAAAWMGYQRLVTPYRGWSGDAQFVEIPYGAGADAIARRLADAGVVPDRWSFRAAVRLHQLDGRLRAGEYRFVEAASPIDVAARIASGDVFLVGVTFREGLTIDEMARLFEAGGFGSAESFRRAAGDSSSLAGIDAAARDLEGYLFPDTYAVPRKTDAEQLVRLMRERFDDVFTEELRREAAAQGLTLRQAITLASLVEKETARADERPLVASVYRNRLRIGMPLQCDPTVIYALVRDGRYDGNLRRSDLSYDSPYNTYRYPGLPPGPIASPGRASIEAALRPASSEYLYFVSRNDGSHEFARTFAEHARNVQRYQVEYFRQRRLQSRGAR
jgi:UPF0755 protein